MTKENIFSFIAYKAYLRANIKSRPQAGRGVLTELAQYMSMTSAQLSHVMRGDRDLTFEQALRATKFLGLDRLESEFFIETVMYARAGTRELREFSKQKLETLKTEALKIKHQVPQHRELSDADKARFYSSWLYSAVRLLSSIRPLHLEDVMEEFNVSRSRASDVLNFLVETSLCLVKPDGIVMGTQTTFVSRGTPFVLKHHANWRLQGLARAEDGNESDLFFTSPVSLSRSDFDKLLMRLTETIKDFSATVKSSPEEMVACLNLDFFSVAGSKRKTT